MALFTAIDGEGTGLFEGNDGRTLLMARAAVRCVVRGPAVTVTALSANGVTLLSSVRDSLAPFVTSIQTDELILSVPAPTSSDPAERLTEPQPLHIVRSLLRAATPVDPDPFAAVAIGVVGFDYAAFLENIPDTQTDPHGFPDALFWIPDSLVWFDRTAQPRVICAAFAHRDHEEARQHRNDAVVRLAALVDVAANAPTLSNPPQPAPVPATPDLDDAAFRSVVRRAKKAIAAGEVYQIVPSRSFSAPCPDPLSAFAAIRALEPNSYRYFLRAAGTTLLGASPETSVKVTRSDGLTVEVKPIAGTRPRGSNPDEDDRLEAELRLNHKELAEHMMLVDLARNDVARISLLGTRHVAKLLTVERYARVMHLVSSVTGTLAVDLDAWDALAACLNVGTLTGAPKIRAMELLRDLDATRRGAYGGAVGWVNASGEMDTAVVIRSAVVVDGVATVRAGAGVIRDSDPQAEADESRRKASALLSVVGGAAPATKVSV